MLESVFILPLGLKTSSLGLLVAIVVFGFLRGSMLALRGLAKNRCMD